MQFIEAYTAQRTGTLTAVDGEHLITLTYDEADPDWCAPENHSWVCTCGKGGSGDTRTERDARAEAARHTCNDKPRGYRAKLPA